MTNEDFFCIFALMKMTETLRRFVVEHSEEDVLKLLLNASRHKDIDIKFAAMQIAARRRAKEKLPSWHANSFLLFPSELSVEQSSSEDTALYKQRLIDCNDVLCDLTGGLGVDVYFFSRKVRQAMYIEKNEAYCDAARDNMKQLKALNIEIVHGDSASIVKSKDSPVLADVNVFFIDPARRSPEGKRVFAIEDCEPDLIKLWPFLCEKQCKIIVKLSPMLDISRVLALLPGIGEVHVVSVKNDCKELLVVTNPSTQEHSDIHFHCINFTSQDIEQSFYFNLSQEQMGVAPLAKCIGRYLYEPNASVLKAGAYNMAALHFGLEKVHVNSHLYTSETLESSFAGRIFEVDQVYIFNNRLCKILSAEIPKANISTRNFPLSAGELRKRIRIAEGGDVYLFATTFSDNKKVIIKCSKKT